ncbi:MAG: hypothetical protein AAF614_27585 [Chloroflexota bacterium]
MESENPVLERHKRAKDGSATKAIDGGEVMKGLDIAKDFYVGWGREYLAKSFPDLAKRVAVGHVSGSDVLGADDEISKDHNWGPQFTLFLSAEDFAMHGERVAAVIAQHAILL